MYVVIYRFSVQPGKDRAFKEAWQGLTKLIYQYEGSLGSHLHRSTQDPLDYIAYAQWPDEETWKNSGDNLPEEANQWRAQMHEACAVIETLHTLQSVNDLKKIKPFKPNY